jgi:hypothetical protein
MSGEGISQLTRLQIPNFDSFVRTPTHKSLSIWVNGNRTNIIGMPSEGVGGRQFLIRDIVLKGSQGKSLWRRCERVL